jgi:hypothetical protein
MDGKGKEKLGKDVAESAPADSEKMLKDVFRAVSTMTEGMEKILNRIGALEAKAEGNRRVTMSRGGGSAAEAAPSGDSQKMAKIFSMVRKLVDNLMDQMDLILALKISVPNLNALSSR